MTEDPRGKRGSFQTSYKLLSIFYTRSIYTKIYLCIRWPAFYFRDTNRRFTFGIWVAVIWGRIDNLITMRGKTQKDDLKRVKTMEKHVKKGGYTAKWERNYIFGVCYFNLCEVFNFCVYVIMQWKNVKVEIR